MIKDILTKNGYNIAGEAENGVKAVEKYSETKPDLVLMDITMPEMDGIQALKKIKEASMIATFIIVITISVNVLFSIIVAWKGKKKRVFRTEKHK